jgi:hypothetical protein
MMLSSSLAYTQSNGGNPLGIKEEDGPLFRKINRRCNASTDQVDIVFSTTVSWDRPEDDDIMREVSHRIIDRTIALGKKRGLYHPFLYQNYAAAQQDVMSSYGQENKDKLLAIQNKYDPHGVFSKLQPGHFKL